jgi:hypothetical protein
VGGLSMARVGYFDYLAKVFPTLLHQLRVFVYDYCEAPLIPRGERQ